MLLATLLEVRRRQVATPGSDRASEPAGAPVESSGPALEAAAIDLLPSSEIAASDTPPTVQETPEWEPQPATSPAESDETAGTMASAAAAEESEEAVAEPTPTAMGEANVWDEPDLTEPADTGVPFDTSEPDLETATPDPFVAEIENEPFAADATEEPPTQTESDRVLEKVAAGVAAEENIPEEEPFERAGRWWFKRGPELLVYNEQTGEWMPSPTPLPTLESPDGEAAPASRFGPDATVTQTITDITTTAPEAEEEPGQQGFWKCPTCGAVNGSTATSCRMCFSARPAG